MSWLGSASDISLPAQQAGEEVAGKEPDPHDGERVACGVRDERVDAIADRRRPIRDRRSGQVGFGGGGVRHDESLQAVTGKAPASSTCVAWAVLRSVAL